MVSSAPQLIISIYSTWFLRNYRNVCIPYRVRSAVAHSLYRGALATFATESTGFSTAFPGIRPHLLTLASNFHVPLYRDILLALGVCSVSRASCANILREGNGNAICIVVGGAAESLSAHPGTADLTLRRRLGFIKLALQYGADLVPVFSFGENDVRGFVFCLDCFRLRCDRN